MCSVAFSPDGRHIVSGSSDNTVHIWNVATGQSEAELKGHSSWVNSVVFSPDGSHVVSGSKDNTMCIWNVATGESEAELKGHSYWVNSVAFSPDGSCVVSGSGDNTVCIWNVATGQSKAELNGHSGWVNSVVFSPDGSHVVSILNSLDDTVCIWNVATNESVELMGCWDRVNSVIFSPDGSCIVSGSINNTLHIWNISSFLLDYAQLLLLPGKPSFNLDSPWIVQTSSGLKCWLPPQYHKIQSFASHTTLFSIGLESGLVLAVNSHCSDPPNNVLT